ncbi:MAG: AAA family ATPase [Nostocales cyanobacterium 94392]|nr:AAA family ATPase [Nostocales cyanobacterium 94392]
MQSLSRLVSKSDYTSNLFTGTSIMPFIAYTQQVFNRDKYEKLIATDLKTSHESSIRKVEISFYDLELAGGRFDGWAKVRPLERKLIDAMIGSKCHIIATMRSKTEWLIEENQKNGKSSYSPKKVGTSPIQASGVEYEFDVAGELDYTHILTISKSRCPAITDKTFLNPGKELALEFKSWLATVEESPPQTTVETVPDTQDLRVKQIRTLLDYPVELIKEWLRSQFG